MSAPDSDFPRNGAVLGVDYGTVRIGLALGEIATGLVLPLHVLENPGSPEGVVERIAAIARSRDAVAVALGNPVHMTGESSNMSRVVQKLKEGLEATLGVPVLLRDERLTSVGAEESLAALGLKWWQYPKSAVDTVAAMTIVKELLSELRPELGRVAEEEPPLPSDSERRDKSAKAERRRKHQKRRGRGDEA